MAVLVDVEAGDIALATRRRMVALQASALALPLSLLVLLGGLSLSTVASLVDSLMGGRMSLLLLCCLHVSFFFLASE